MPKKSQFKEREYILAYACYDDYFDNSVFLMNEFNKNDLFLIKRPSRVDNLCFVPNQGLYDSGEYVTIYDNICRPNFYYEFNYTVSCLKRLLDETGNIIDESIISVDEIKKGHLISYNSPYIKKGSLSRVLEDENFSEGRITSMCFVPNQGLIVSKSYDQQIFQISDNEGKLIRNNISYFPRSKGWTYKKFKIVYSSKLDIIQMFENNIFLRKNKKNVRIDLPLKYGSRLIDIVFASKLSGLYFVAFDLVSNKYCLFHCLNTRGKKINKIIEEIYLNNLCYVPNKGLFGSDSNKIIHILNEKGELIPKDNRTTKITKNKISALTAVPKSFYEYAKTSNR